MLTVCLLILWIISFRLLLRKTSNIDSGPNVDTTTTASNINYISMNLKPKKKRNLALTRLYCYYYNWKWQIFYLYWILLRGLSFPYLIKLTGSASNTLNIVVADKYTYITHLLWSIKTVRCLNPLNHCLRKNVTKNYSRHFRKKKIKLIQ